MQISQKSKRPFSSLLVLTCGATMERSGSKDEAVWVEAFVTAISRMGVRGEAHFISDMGKQLHATQGHLAPEKVAQSQWDEWLPSGPAPMGRYER